MADLPYGNPLPPDFEDGNPLTAAQFNAVKNYWVTDELPEDAPDTPEEEKIQDGDVVFVIGAPVDPTPSEVEVEYLVVAGGGGGGGAKVNQSGVGGGGAGGYRSAVPGQQSGGGSSAEAPVKITKGETVVVTVGSGGSGSADQHNAGTNGTPSTFHTVESLGGGGGGGNQSFGGGSGGAPSGKGTIGQGSDGGIGDNQPPNYVGGGGGGAGAAGGVGTNARVAGDGGDGLSSNITGDAVMRGGGGGGGTYRQDSVGDGTAGSGGAGGGGAGKNDNSNGVNGDPNTGGGGGAGGAGGGDNASNVTGGNGGDGVVVLRFDESFNPTIDIGLELADGDEGNKVINGKRILTFIGGTGEVTF